MGTYSTTVRFATGDENGSDVVFEDLPITLNVINQLSLSEEQLTLSQVNGSPTPPETQAVDVTLNLEPHRLFATDDGVALADFPTAPSVLGASVVVADNAGSSAVWDAASDQSWLTVAASGVIGGTVELTADPAGLAADEIHFAEVTLTSSEPTVEYGDSITVGLYVASADSTVSDTGVGGSYITSDLITEIETNSIGSEFATSAAQDGRSLYMLRAYVSGLLDLERHTIECSSLTGACASTEKVTLNRSFANVLDIAATGDGDKVYTASGGEYSFPTFAFSGGAIVEQAVLEGAAYPVAAELGPTGKFYGGRDAGNSATAIDVWSYTSDDMSESTFVLDGALQRRQLAVFGDGLRLIALLDSMIFTAVTP